MSLSIIFPTIVPFDITEGNARIDSTTDNAFIAPVGVDLSPYRGKFMELWSGSTLWAQAWISATAPAGETLSPSALNVNNCINGLTAAFTTFTDATPSGFTVSTTGLSGRASTADEIVVSAGDLLKWTFSMAKTSGNFASTSIAATTSGGSMSYWAQVQTTVEGANTVYRTPDTTGTGVIAFTASGTPAFTVSSLDVRKVTDPAATGALLLSSQGGSRGWAYKHASFNPNAALTMRILAKRKVSGNGSYLV